MRGSRIRAVWAKELREAVRDRRTLMSTLVLPTIVMPLLFLAVGVLSARIFGKARAERSAVMVLGGDDSPGVRAVLEKAPKLQCMPAAAEWRTLVSDKKIRAVVSIPPGFDQKLDRGEPEAVTIYDYEGELRSGLAVAEVRRVLSDYRQGLVRARLESRGLPPGLVQPFDLNTQNVAPPEKVGGNLFGGMIPYLFIIFCVTGALYPAIDLTAGEKERGTMETILCSPVTRGELVMGKFLTVLTASVVTVVASIASMTVTVTLGGSLLASKSVGAASMMGAVAGKVPVLIDPLGLAAVVVLALPSAAMFSALLLAISVTAKTSKEAQSYAMPVMMLVLLPAMTGLMPGLELSARVALIPVMNLALASKELLSGVWHWNLLALIFVSSCVYAALALRFCVSQFNRESVLFRG